MSDRAQKRKTAIEQVAELRTDMLANGFEQYRVDELRHVAAGLSLRFNYAGDEWVIRWDLDDLQHHVFRMDLRLNKSVADQLQPVWSQWLAFQSGHPELFEPAPDPV